ncbi:MAG: hypothetical protein HYU70_14395 [Bacteroidetes bacterium]|nr:hypothetical protein [Bacteroidota bacterium]
MSEKDQPKEEQKKKQSVKTILDNFKKNIFGIEYYFNKFESLAQGADVDGLKQTSQYIQKCFEEIGIDIKSSKKEQEGIRIPSDKVLDLFRKLRKQPKISAANYEILSRSSFLMLNNYFEYILSDLLSYHYNKFQKSLNEKKFNLTLKEINEYETVEDFTKALVTKEVESMMVDLSFDELIEHFHETLGIDKENEIVNWDVILECRERRHLIVHNSSLVNKKYITRSKNPFKLNVGDTVHVDKEYFMKTCKEFFLAGLLISFNCWGKWDKESATDAIKEIMDDSFELLKQNESLLVSRFTEYISKIEPRNEKEEDYIMRARFNRLIALKKLGNKEALAKELKKVKTGTASPIFKLAYAILSEDHTKIVELVKQSISLDELDLSKYKEWPIYEFVRNNKDINSKIEAELGIIGTNKVLPKAGPGKQKPSSNKKSIAVPTRRIMPSKKR